MASLELGTCLCCVATWSYTLISPQFPCFVGPTGPQYEGSNQPVLGHAGWDRCDKTGVMNELPADQVVNKFAGKYLARKALGYSIYSKDQVEESWKLANQISECRKSGNTKSVNIKSLGQFLPQNLPI